MNLDDIDNESRWDEILPELEEFQRLLAPTVPQLNIERQSDVLAWQQKTGVYFLFTDNGRLVDIGFTFVDSRSGSPITRNA